MIGKAFKYNSKTFLNTFLIISAAYFTGQGVVNIAQSGSVVPSVGGLFRNFIPVLLCVSLIALFSGSIDLISLLKFGNLNYAQMLLVVVTGLSITPLIKFATNYGLTYTAIGLFCISGVLASFYLVLIRQQAYGILFALVTLPFIAFLEWSFRETVFGGFYWGPFSVTPSVIYLCFFIIMCFVGLLKSPASHVSSTVGAKVHVLVSFYVLLWFLSAVASNEPVLSLRGFFTEAVILPSFFLVAEKSVTNKKEVACIFYGLLLYCVLKLGVHYYFLIQHEGFKIVTDLYTHSKSYYEIISNVGNVAFLAMYGLPFAYISIYLCSKVRFRKIFFQCLTAWLFAVIVFSRLRAELLATILAGGFVLLFMQGYRSISSKIIILLLALFVCFYSTLPNTRIFERWKNWTSVDNVLASQKIRLTMWSHALQKIREHPALGIGYGEWGMWNKHPFKFSGTQVIGEAHNLFLNFAVIGGFPLLLSLILFIISILKRAAGIARFAVDSGARHIAYASLWGILAFVVLSAIGGRDFFVHTEGYHGNVHFLDAGILFWLTCGLICALPKISGGNQIIEQTSPEG